jgi:hypothetical protein
MPAIIRNVTEAERDALFARYAQVKPAFDALKDEMDQLKQQLKPYFAERGEKITSTDGITLRMDGRTMLNQEKFLVRVGARIFATVSKRVAVAALIKAAVIKGKIKQVDVDACMEPTENWFKIL